MSSQIWILRLNQWEFINLALSFNTDLRKAQISPPFFGLNCSGRNVSNIASIRKNIFFIIITLFFPALLLKSKTLNNQMYHDKVELNQPTYGTDFLHSITTGRRGYIKYHNGEGKTKTGNWGSGKRFWNLVSDWIFVWELNELLEKYRRIYLPLVSCHMTEQLFKKD